MDFEQSSIERLKRSLYSRDESKVPKEKRTPVRGIGSDVRTSWGEKPSFEISLDDMREKKNSFFNKFFIVAAAFFLISLFVALFIFFGGINMISSNNVDVKVVAPSSISSGEELDLGLSVINGNRTDLQSVILYIDYPEGARTIDTKNTIVTRQRIDLGDIPHGGNKDYSIRTTLLGGKDAIKTFTFTLEYKVTGSNAIFSKIKKYDVTIGSAPFLLSVTAPAEINSGQQVTLSIDLISNSATVIQNTLLKVMYPYGFTYQSSNLKPFKGNGVWSLGDLKDGDKKTLTITGTLVGQNLDGKSFQITIGSGANPTAQDFDTALATAQSTVSITKSFFNLSTVDLDNPNGVAQIGRMIPMTVSWQNTLTEKVINNHITIRLSGNALDRSRVNAGNGGFYQSQNNTILWDKNSTDSLREISPDALGTINFSLVSLSDPMVVRSMRNPHIDVHVEMTGDKSSSDVSSVSSTNDITVRLDSTLNLDSKVYRTLGAFTNTGPIPPKADVESTYTITWTLTNTTNNLSNTLVTATVPAGVSWKSEISPVSEHINYNPDTQQITWSAGNIGAGAGFTSSAKEVSFKIGITPSVSSVGSAPILLSTIHAESIDTYTSSLLTQNIERITTQFYDPSYVPGQDTVVK